MQAGKEIRNVEDWRVGATMSVDDAAQLFAQPKFQRAARTPVAPIKEFPQFEGAAGPVRVLSGRFGPDVTDGETNATLPRTQDPAQLSEEQAKELPHRKREAGPAPKRGRFVKKPAAKKASSTGRARRSR